VVGASGYPGGELLRYLAGHPSLEVVWATAHTNAGKPLGEVFGNLVGMGDLVLVPTDPDGAPELDLVFLGLPHGEAAEMGRRFVERGVKVVDLAADWRLHEASAYDTWYGWAHPYPDELARWIFGLTELHRDEIGTADAVANPGCYPTAALFPLAPALRAGAIEPDGIVIDAASGISGAGRKVDATYLFTELDASYSAYGVGKHRHTPEIEQELGTVVTFTPHLAPMSRGILATCYARMTGDVEDVRSAIEAAYKDEPFVHLVDRQPATKQVSGTNHALVAVDADTRTRTAVLTCAIDNLGKGAAGQALQNANVMLGLDETAGLEGLGVFP
jgi:N-acetyl-gamma-glutamyl-phosphate reductase